MELAIEELGGHCLSRIGSRVVAYFLVEIPESRAY